MYPSFGSKGRDMILYFLNKHFGDRENLVTPINPLPTQSDFGILAKLFFNKEMRDDYKKLNAEVRSLGQNIPPLVNAYMNLSATMKVFGTAVNDEFGYVEETGILITISDIYEEKRMRYIESYVADLKNDLRLKRFILS
jgi:hypothetical protein